MAAMEGLSLGVSSMSLSSKCSLPPINNSRKNSLSKKENRSAVSAGKSRVAGTGSAGGMGMGMDVSGSGLSSAMVQAPRSTGSQRAKVTSAPSSNNSAPINGKSGEPAKMQRATQWSPEVENAFRFQSAGFRDAVEYAEKYPPPEVWEDSGFVRQLQVKTTGYFMYFRQTRECHDKYLGKTRLYSY